MERITGVSAVYCSSGMSFPGGKLIGSTDSDHNPAKLRASDLTPVTRETSGEIRLNISHVHKALRKLAGIDREKELERYEITEPLLPVFES